MVSAVFATLTIASHQPYALHRIHVPSHDSVDPGLYLFPAPNDDDVIQISLNGQTATLTIENKTEFEIPFYRTAGPLIYLEAKKDGDWKPIEYWAFATCGFGIDYGLLKPGDRASTATTLFPGNYQTEIRAGMYLCKGIFTHSKPIHTTINENMFFRSPYRRSSLGPP